MLRRAIAVGIGLVVLLLLIFGVRGCLDSRKERAFKDYVRDVSALVDESDQQSEAFYELLGRGGQSAVDLQNDVSASRVQAEQLVERAEGTDRPDELATAHRHLVELLGFRRDGLRTIARLLPTALGDEGRSEATRRIAAQMQNFLASDVIYSQRFFPAMRGALEDEDLLDDVPIPDGLTDPKVSFLPDIDWLRPTTVADRVSRIRGGGGQEAASPGLHGNGLGTVTAQPGGAQLSDGQATEIKVSGNLAFEVQIQNQGENAEEDVAVTVTVRGGGKTIRRQAQLDTIAAGESKEVTIPLADTPPTGRPVAITVRVAAVPGEQKTDNNRGSFTAIFTR